MHISTHVFVRSPYSYSYCKEFDVLVYCMIILRYTLYLQLAGH